MTPYERQLLDDIKTYREALSELAKANNALTEAEQKRERVVKLANETHDRMCASLHLAIHGDGQ